MWTALTGLFLDTEQTDQDLVHIAQVVRQAGYSPEQMHQILFEEVAPVFVTNLLSVAGEWTPWTDSFVEEKMRERMSRGHSRSWPSEQLAKRLLRDDLKRLEACLLAEAENTKADLPSRANSD